MARDWTRPRFFFMGYDWERKNGPMVLRAFAQLREKFPHARLDVAGGHPRIEMDGIVTHGSLDFSEPSDRAQAEALFEKATCFVMPSKFEPFGMVYVEAAAAGVPSIGTTVGGARDIIGEGAGLLVDPSDERALAEAMAALCDPEIASRMGNAALERSRHFTWPAVAERILQVLEPSWNVERASPGDPTGHRDFATLRDRNVPDTFRTMRVGARGEHARARRPGIETMPAWGPSSRSNQ
ncbi:MAG: glycosyltransferase family 4 protein [Gaiellaceae bacterium]